MPNYITVNPAIAALQAGENAAYQREERDYRRDQRRQEQVKNKALGQAAMGMYDQPAISGVVAQQPGQIQVPADQPPASPISQVVAGPQQTPSPASPPQAAVPAAPASPRMRNGSAVRTLVEGGAGTEAFRLAQEDRKAADAMDDKFVSMLGSAKTEADVQMALNWGRQRGIELPPEIASNRRQMAKIIGAAQVVHQLGLKGSQAQAAFKSVLGGGNPEDIAKSMGTPNKQIRWYDSMRGVGITEEGEPVQIPNLPARPVRSSGGGGGSTGNRVQSTKINERGELILVMRDGTVKTATDEKGSPIRGPEARKLAGTLVGKLIGDPLEKNPVGKAQGLAGQVWNSGTPSQSGNTGARPPLSSFER